MITTPIRPICKVLLPHGKRTYPFSAVSNEEHVPRSQSVQVRRVKGHEHLISSTDRFRSALELRIENFYNPN